MTYMSLRLVQSTGLLMLFSMSETMKFLHMGLTCDACNTLGGQALSYCPVQLHCLFLGLLWPCQPVFFCVFLVANLPLDC